MLDLKQAKALCDAATPGPWKPCGASDGKCECRLLWSVPADRVLVHVPNEGSNMFEESGIGTHADLEFTAASRTLLPEALDEIERLRAELEMSTGPRCPGCSNAIDPDVCWCGTSAAQHIDDHPFVPMGCDCLRVERDWQKLAAARGEHVYQLRAERDAALAKLKPLDGSAVAVITGSRTFEEQLAERDKLKKQNAALRTELEQAVTTKRTLLRRAFDAGARGRDPSVANDAAFDAFYAELGR